MNGAKIYYSKSGNLETIKLRHILFPWSSWSVRFTFKRYQSSSFNSTFWVYYEVEQS